MTLSQARRYAGIFAAAALLVTAVSLKPVLAMGSDTPYPTTDDSNKKKEKRRATPSSRRNRS